MMNVCLLVGLCCFLLGACRSQQSRPNIIFILIDDLGFGDVSFTREYSEISGFSLNQFYNTTTIDTLATQSGMILNHHYVHSTCSQTRSAFLTGKYPSAMGFARTPTVVKIFQEKTLENEVTLPKMLSEYGNYATFMAGKWHVGYTDWEHTALGHFDYAMYSNLGSINHYTHSNCVGLGSWPRYDEVSLGIKADIVSKYGGNVVCLYDLWTNINETVMNQSTYAGDVWIEDLYSDEISQFIDNWAIAHNYATVSPTPAPTLSMEDSDMITDLATKDAFFMYYAAHTPHDPIINPPSPYSYATNCNHITGDATRKRQCRMVQYLDSKIEDLINQLKSYDGLHENTIIVISNDNGGSTGDARGLNLPLRGSKGNHFEGGVRSASLITGGYLSDTFYGCKYPNLMSIEDWFLTFLNMAKIDVNDINNITGGITNFNSFNHWDIFNDSNIICNNTHFIDPSNSHGQPREEWIELTSVDFVDKVIVRNDGYKLIFNDGQLNQAKKKYVNCDNTLATVGFSYDATTNVMLFNIFDDPYETTNLIGINQYYIDIENALNDSLNGYLTQTTLQNEDQLFEAVKSACELQNTFSWRSNPGKYVDFSDTPDDVYSLLL